MEGPGRGYILRMLVIITVRYGKKKNGKILDDVPVRVESSGFQERCRQFKDFVKYAVWLEISRAITTGFGTAQFSPRYIPGPGHEDEIRKGQRNCIYSSYLGLQSYLLKNWRRTGGYYRKEKQGRN